LRKPRYTIGWQGSVSLPSIQINKRTYKIRFQSPQSRAKAGTLFAGIVTPDHGSAPSGFVRAASFTK
jgi:hypothetical protein